jgi:DDE superfamily endonuclease
MLPDVTLPASLAGLLAQLRPCFTAPSFRTFCGLAAGLAAWPRRRSVVGMLLGAGLSAVWPHDRAHYFFARARWQIDELGLAVARLVVELLVSPGEPLTVAVDDSLFRRTGRKVYGAGWQHDGSAPGRRKTGFGTCFVTAGIIVRLPFLARPACLPVLARLVLPGKKVPWWARGSKTITPAAGTKTATAVTLVTLLAAAFPGRTLHVVADAAYHGPALKLLPPAVTWTTRLPVNAVLHDLAPPRPPGTRGRRRRKGERLGTPAQLAEAAHWTPATVHAYGRDQHKDLAGRTCLWYGCLDTTTVRVILARDDHGLLALVSTDLTTPADGLISRYAARWSIEMVFPQLAKGPVRPVGGGWQHVADLDLAAGDDHTVDQQLGQLPPLGEGGGGQPGPDGAAEPLDPAGDGLQFEPLPGGGLQLPLLGQQRGVAAV